MEGFSISNQMNSRNPFEKEKAICKKPFELSWLSLYGFCLLSWVFGLVVFAEFANSLLPHFTFKSYHFEYYNALARYLQGLSLLLDIFKHFLQLPNIHQSCSSTGPVWFLLQTLILCTFWNNFQALESTQRAFLWLVPTVGFNCHKNSPCDEKCMCILLHTRHKNLEQVPSNIFLFTV